MLAFRELPLFRLNTWCLNFCGRPHLGAIGHAKVELLTWADRPKEWLQPGGRG